MPRAVLLYNPKAGDGSQGRTALLERIAHALRERGLHATALATEGPGSAGAQAKAAADNGADIVFACGGDGTVHEVVQGLAHHPTPAALGIVPLGTGNVLARHIGLPLCPLRAALAQLDFAARRVPLGHVTFVRQGAEHTRYFTVLAGAGPDGTLIYGMLAAGSSGKGRFGRVAYYLHALRLFVTERHRRFDVELTTTLGVQSQAASVGALSSRVADLGGLFSPLAGGARLEDTYLKLTLLAPPAWPSLLAWFGFGWLGLNDRNPLLKTLTVAAFTCRHTGAHPICVEADGEYLGHTPMTVTLVQDALRMLLPPSGRSPSG